MTLRNSPLLEAIGATDSLREVHFCLAVLGEDVDTIARVLRRYLDLRDGRVETPEWALRSLAGGRSAGAVFQSSRLAPGGESGQKAPAVPDAALSDTGPSDRDPSYRPGVTPDRPFGDIGAT